MIGEHSDLLYRLSKAAAKQGKATAQRNGEQKEEKKESDSSSCKYQILILVMLPEFCSFVLIPTFMHCLSFEYPFTVVFLCHVAS